MSAFLQVWLVKYKCSCSSWFPLSQLYFCRICAKLKCPICISEEIDIIFCPNCHEKSTSSEAVQKRFLCAACHACPFCGNLLGVRSQADLFYLQCNACQWTSRGLGVHDRTVPNEPWPEPNNPIGEELSKVMATMKGLNNWERIEREVSKRTHASNFEMVNNYERLERETNKRLSNLGILHNDRFKLQSACNLRKKALHQRTEKADNLELLAPSADVPELDSEIFTVPPKPENTLGLAQIIAHPVTGPSGQLYPSRVRMISRRAMRCLDCETMLYKGELSPNVVKPRLQSFALSYFPELRISRHVRLVPGQSSAFFLTITNNTNHAMDVELCGKRVEGDDGCVDTSKFTMQLTIPNKDEDTASVASSCAPPIEQVAAVDQNEITSRVLYVSQHRAGICVECLPPEEGASGRTNYYALFALSFSLQPDNPSQKFGSEIRVQLESSGP